LTTDGSPNINAEKTNAMNFWFYITTILVLLPGIMIYITFQLYKRFRTHENPLLKFLPFMDSNFGDAGYILLFTCIILETPSIVEIILSVVLHMIICVNVTVGCLKLGKPVEPTSKLNDEEKALNNGLGSEKNLGTTNGDVRLDDDNLSERSDFLSSNKGHEMMNTLNSQ
jgi:hypothetical protein